MTYNEQGKRTSLENLAGQVTTTAWDCSACTPVGELIPAAKNAKSAKLASAFDDGNQTLVTTATGIWSVTYNGENRPVLFWREKLTFDLWRFKREGYVIAEMEFESPLKGWVE